MAKTITFTYKKTAYTLEYTRETVSLLEQNGLSLSDVQNILDRPITSMKMLFTGAFLAHHRKAASITTLMDEIWETIPNKDELIGNLVEMYAEPIDSMMSEPEEEKGKTVWTVNE
jgi:hypothetical protein